jgi:hypothetical protein
MDWKGLSNDLQVKSLAIRNGQKQIYELAHVAAKISDINLIRVLHILFPILFSL